MQYILVDFMHVCYKYMTVTTPLSAVVYDTVLNEPVLVDTTLLNFVTKDIWAKGARGASKIGVFFEGGCAVRKSYFAGTGNGKGYKGGRSGLSFTQKEQIDLVQTKLIEGGASTYRAYGYEADDSIYTMIQVIQEQDPDAEISVITNDGDLLPLATDKVSVYMRGQRTYAQGDTSYKNYFQVNKDTWEEYTEVTAKYREYDIPYNSMLLWKVIKGDPADNIPAGAKGYGPAAYNEKIKLLREAPFIRNTDDAKRVWNRLIQQVQQVYKPEEELLKLQQSITKGASKTLLKTVEALLTGGKCSAKAEAKCYKDIAERGLYAPKIKEYKEMRQALRGVYKVEGRYTQLQECKSPEVFEDWLAEVCRKYKVKITDINFKNIFNYGVDFSTFCHYGQDEAQFEERTGQYLKQIFTPFEVENITFNYRGMNLRDTRKTGADLQLPERIQQGELQGVLSKFRIVLPNPK